jgi:hypothetical protein
MLDLVCMPLTPHRLGLCPFQIRLEFTNPTSGERCFILEGMQTRDGVLEVIVDAVCEGTAIGGEVGGYEK